MTRNIVYCFMHFRHSRVALAVLFDSLPIPIYKHCLSKAKKGAKVSTTEERRRGERRHGERPHRKCRQKNLRLDSCFLPVK